MELYSAADPASTVSQPNLEALLDEISARTPNPIDGIYGPDSLSWRINRESALFLGAGRAALLQLAHPWVATALAQHSTLLARPIARFHSTFRIVFTMIFGSLPQALTAARQLYARHTNVRGEIPQDVGDWQRGAHYEANEISALRWVHATLVESAVFAYECALSPLTAAEREQYYAESKILAALCGIPSSALPENWSAFAAYNQQMHASGALCVNDTARTMAHNLMAGSGSRIKPPSWYRALTVEWLPERFRAEFAFSFGPSEQAVAERARRRLPRIYKSIPRALRFSGPWHQAQARIAGRHVGMLTRFSNRFWIGQPLLPFS